MADVEIPDIDTPTFGESSWSPTDNHLILTNSTGSDPTTIVTLVITNASSLGSGWIVRARTTKANWRNSDWVSLNSDTTEIPIVLGDNEVPSFGGTNNFTIKTQAKSPDGVTYTNSVLLSCQLTNYYGADSSQIHFNASWLSGNKNFSLPTDHGTDDPEVNRTLFWDVLDSGEIQDVSATTDVGSIRERGPDHPHIVDSGNGILRYYFVLTLKSSDLDDVSPETTVNATFTVTMNDQTSTSGDTLTGNINLYDTTAPAIEITQNKSRTNTRYSSHPGFTTTSLFTITFKVTDEHSSVVAGDIVGTHPYVICSASTNDALTASDLSSTLRQSGVQANGAFTQKVRVPAGHAPPGGSVTHTYTVVAEDTAGNIGYADASFTLNRYDDVAPVISNVSYNNANTFNSINNTYPNETVQVTFDVTDDIYTINASNVTVIKNSTDNVGGDSDTVNITGTTNMIMVIPVNVANLAHNEEVTLMYEINAEDLADPGPNVSDTIYISFNVKLNDNRPTSVINAGSTIDFLDNNDNDNNIKLTAFFSVSDRILTLDELVFNVTTSDWNIQKNNNTGIVSVSKTIDLDSYSDDSVTVELTASKYNTYSSIASHTFDLTVPEPVEDISSPNIIVTNNNLSRTVSIAADFYNFENDIDVNGTQIVDASGNNLENYTNLTTTLSSDKKSADVTATLSYNYNDTDLIVGDNVISIKIGVSDLNGNMQLSDDIDFIVTKEYNASSSNTLPTLSTNDIVFKDSYTEESITKLNISQSNTDIIIEFSGSDNLYPSLKKNNEDINNRFDFSNGVYTWEVPITQSEYNVGSNLDTYSIYITNGSESTSISKEFTVVKNDVIAPTITIESVEAFAINNSDVVATTPLTPIDGQIILYTNSIDPTTDGSQPHQARLKITAEISDEGGLNSTSPAISDATGWSRSLTEENDTYVWQKDVSSTTPGTYQINITVNAVDISNNTGTPVTATFNINTIDNTAPAISNFSMSGIGIDEFSEKPTITLRESTLRDDINDTQDAIIKLEWNDNGTTNAPVVTINYGNPTISSDTLTASQTTTGEYIYDVSFGYNNFTDIELPVGQIIPVTITATVTDASLNVTSKSLTADLQLIDNTLPLISTYSLFGSDTILDRLDLSFNNNQQYEFISSEASNNNDTLFLEANVIAEDLRGIAKIDVSSNPALSWVEDSSGKFHADIGFNDLEQFSTNYIYNIIAKVEDNTRQVASSTKTIIFSKRNDGLTIGEFGSISGLTDNQTVILKTSDPSEKTLRIDINVNEDTIGTMGTAELTGTNDLTIQLVGVQHKTESTRVYSFDVTLDRDNYDTQSTNSETLTFKINQPPELAASSGVISKSINVELINDSDPTGSISSTADSKIDGGINMVNLTTNLAQLGYKIYIYANFLDSQMSSNTIGIIGSDVNLTFYKISYNAYNNQAVFVATVTSAFYSSLTKYNEYEYKTFTVTGLDLNDSTVSMDITIGFKRSNVLATAITNFSLSDTSIVHLDSDTEETINVLLFAEVSGESGLSDQYVTYTKNDVEQQNVKLPSEDFTGSWSQLTFESVKPVPFNPTALDDDVYVFTLHCVDLNNQKSTAEATLTVKYGNADDPIIYNANFYQDDAVITQKYISVNENTPPYTIQETVQFKARISDLNDNINQLTIDLSGNGQLSNSSITDISRVDNEDIDGNDYAVFDVILITNSDWRSFLQPITVVLTVDDTQGNSVNVTRNLNIAIGDEPPPVISSLTLECFGQNGNNLVADSNANHKTGIVRGEMIAYNNSGLDISSASLVTSDDRTFTYFSNESADTINGYSATKIIFSLMVNYDDPMLADLGEHTLYATASIKDTAENTATLDASCSIVKLDQLAPQILGLAFVDENVTSVRDNVWISPINIANMQNQRSLSSWIIIDTTIINPTNDQVLLSVGGQEDEYTLIMAIKDEIFTVHAGLNKDEVIRNNSAVMLLDMTDSANPLYQFIGSTDSVELALLVRLDIGVIMLYANGRLIAAEQARERSFVAYGGSTATLSVGSADSDINNRSVHANISEGWQGTISAYNIYDWSSDNKVDHESSERFAYVSTNKGTVNGKVVFANLDNEETTLSFTENDVNSTNQVSTFANVSTFDKSIYYNDSLGNDTQNILYVVSSAQASDNSYSDSKTLTIIKVNTDEELPVINDFVITHVTANGGTTDISASDIVAIGSSTEKFLITIDASDNAQSGVADTKSFIIKLGNTTISSTKSNVSYLEYEFELNWDILNQITNVAHDNQYTLAISATVVDDASNVSLMGNKNLYIRTVDNESPIITNAVLNTLGLVTYGKFEDDNLEITVSLSSVDPSNSEVVMTVNFSDNSHHLTQSSISIDASGSVYTNGPDVWTGSNDLGFTVTSFDASNGNYEAKIKRTFEYSELSSKGPHQYRTGVDGNEENWIVTVKDESNQTHSNNFKIKVIVVDDVCPILPSISLNTNNINLGLGEEQQVVATITTGDDYGINKNGVKLLSSVNGMTNQVNDIAHLISNAIISDITPDTPVPANMKVFTAIFDVSYTDLTGDYSTAKDYYIGASITDLALEETIDDNVTTLKITRKDTEAPVIAYAKRNDSAPEYNTYSELLLNDASYNVVSISTAASVPDVRFTITDNDAVNPTTIKMYQSQPIENISTNTLIQDGVYNEATEISMNFVESAYEPATPISFDPDDFSKFYIDGYSYYVWVRVDAEDMAGNKNQLHIPFNINKLDETNPEAAVSVNTTQRIDATEVIGESSGFTTHEDYSQVIANLRSDSTDAVVQIKVVVSDNHEVKSVFAANTDNTNISSATGPFVINGVSTYTIERVYSIEDYNHVGNKLVDDFNVVIEDKTGNTKKHRIPVYINGMDVTAPSINVTMSANTNELKFLGDQLTISVNAEIIDAGSDILVDSVQLVDASEKGYIEKGLVANGTYEWTKIVDWSNTGELSTIINESITIKASDNNNNEQNVNSSLQYKITNNSDIGWSIIRKTLLQEDEQETIIVETVKSVNPSQIYNIVFQWEITDPTNALVDPTNSDVVITGDGIHSLADDVTMENTGNIYIYRAIVALDTNQLTKGQISSISLELTTKKLNSIETKYSITQQFHVWDYETIDLVNDYYIMYDANIHNAMTRLKNIDDAITGYKMTARSTAFTHVNTVQVNYPTGNALVEVAPFEIIKYAENSDTDIAETQSFRVQANVYADSNGTVDAEVVLEDKTITISYVDDYTLAQVIYSNMQHSDPNYKPTINANTPDSIIRNYGPDYLIGNPITRAAISARVVDQGLLASSPPSIGIVNLNEITSQLDQIAQRNGTFGQYNIMQEGDLLVLSLSESEQPSYQRIVSDISGNQIELVASTPIKLVLRQRTGARSI